MKAITFVVCILLFQVLVTTDIFGEDSVSKPKAPEYQPPLVDSKDTDFERTPLNKLARGLVNLAFFWLEVPIQMGKTAKEENEFVGGTVGLAKGAFIGVLRFGTGVLDMVTFIIPPYNRPLMEPEYVFSDHDS